VAALLHTYSGVTEIGCGPGRDYLPSKSDLRTEGFGRVSLNGVKDVGLVARDECDDFPNKKASGLCAVIVRENAR
jgi:hypothetical protein